MRVNVLGRLEVTASDGRHLAAEDLPRRARQVLGVLAARYDRIQSKDALADAVWGDDLPGNHVAALEHYVSVLRRRLQPDRSAAESFIVTRSGGYSFDTSRAELDFADVRRRVRQLDSFPPGSPDRLQLHQEILDLVTDLPFAEDEYADWAGAARTEVRDAVLGSLLQLADAARADDPGRALRLAQEAIDLDPYVEQSYRVAMHACVALGRPDEALRWYERCRRVLEAELGIAPSADTTALHGQILTGRTNPPAQAKPAAPRPAGGKNGTPLRLLPAAEHAGAGSRVPDRTLPSLSESGFRFVGRKTQLDLVLGADPIPVVHIVGPAGAGKSTFLAELARRAPGRVGLGHGPGSAGALRLSWLRAALAELGATGEQFAVIDAAMAQQRPLTRQELEIVAVTLDRAEPVALAIDDAAELDETSVTELAWLSQRCPWLRVVLAYRYPSEAAGQPIGSLPTPVVLRLGPLSPEELDELGEPELAERTGGIPALVAVAHQPQEVASGVAMQIARLRTRWMPETGWEVLRLCAALGSLRVSDLASLSGHPLDAVLACVDQLVHAHLLTEGPGGHVRHRSSLVRAAVAEQVSSASGMHLRERLAAAGQ